MITILVPTFDFEYNNDGRFIGIKPLRENEEWYITSKKEQGQEIVILTLTYSYRKNLSREIQPCDYSIRFTNFRKIEKTKWLKESMILWYYDIIEQRSFNSYRVPSSW